ncbi:unnamed protein product [Effrenium voratum]|nr:unnamed protein product [Effrenium voratum]
MYAAAPCGTSQVTTYSQTVPAEAYSLGTGFAGNAYSSPYTGSYTGSSYPATYASQAGGSYAAPGTLAGGSYGTVTGASYGMSGGSYGGVTGTMSGGSYTAAAPGTLAGGYGATPGTISGGSYSGGTLAGGPSYGNSFTTAPAPSYGTTTYGGYYGSGGSSYSAGAKRVRAMGAPMVGSSSFTAAPPMTTDWSLQPASSMMVTPQLSNPLQSTPSMIAYPGMGAMGAMGAPSYSSAMDGPFKFYATPPGKLPEAEQRPAARMEDEVQTGASLRAGASAPRGDEGYESLELSLVRPGNELSKKSVKKYTSKKKKSGRAMELEVLSVQGANAEQVVSIRAGSQRKQAAVASLEQGTPFRISAGSLNPFRIDVLQQVGSTRLALRPGEGSYSIDVPGAGKDGGNVRVAFAVREASQAEMRKVKVGPRTDPALAKEEEESKRFSSQATAAKEYLESHELLPFVRALLQTVIRDKPADPYSFVAEQFRLAAGSTKLLKKEAQEGEMLEPLLKKAMPFEDFPSKVTQEGAPKFGKRKEEPEVAPPAPAEPVAPAPNPPKVEELRQQVRDVLGQAVEDGRLAESLREAEQPFAAPAPIVVRSKNPPRQEDKPAEVEAFKASRSVLEAADTESTAGADLAKVPVPVLEEPEAEEARRNSDAMSAASHEDTQLAKAQVAEVPSSPQAPLLPKLETTEPEADEPNSTEPAEPPAPVAEQEVLPEQLESLRMKAQEALQAGAASGELWQLLERHAAQKAQQEVIEAARSGSLTHALLQLRPGQLDQLREHAVQSLVMAAESGKLLEALRQTCATGEMANLRKDAQEKIAAAADSGELAEALRASQADAGDMEALRKFTREAMLTAAESGQLAHLLQTETGASIEELRETARDALMKGASSGRLFEVLRQGKAPSQPGSPKGQQDTPEGSVVDITEPSSTEVSKRPSLTTRVATDLVQAMSSDKDRASDMELRIWRLSGEEQTVTISQDASLFDLKSKISATGLANELLAMELLLGGCPLDQRDPQKKLADLGVADGANLTVVAKRSHDYSQITKVDKLVKSEKWPQGVFTTAEGLFYVCHFQGELLVYDQQLQNIRRALLPREMRTPSQMTMAPNGHLVIACHRSYSAAAAVVDPQTMEVIKWFGDTDERSRTCGVAVAEGRVFLSTIPYGGSAKVVVYDFETTKLLAVFGGFENPCGLCVADEKLLVADRSSNKVLILDMMGRLVKEIGGGELLKPNDVALDSSGNILVMDTEHERIAVFAPDGYLLASVLPKSFKNFGNTHSYISVNPLTGTISVSMDDAHQVAIVAPPIFGS